MELWARALRDDAGRARRGSGSTIAGASEIAAQVRAGQAAGEFDAAATPEEVALRARLAARRPRRAGDARRPAGRARADAWSCSLEAARAAARRRAGSANRRSTRHDREHELLAKGGATMSEQNIDRLWLAGPDVEARRAQGGRWPRAGGRAQRLRRRQRCGHRRGDTRPRQDRAEDRRRSRLLQLRPVRRSGAGQEVREEVRRPGARVLLRLDAGDDGEAALGQPVRPGLPERRVRRQADQGATSCSRSRATSSRRPATSTRSSTTPGTTRDRRTRCRTRCT